MTFKNGNWVAEGMAEQAAINYLNKKKENSKTNPFMSPPVTQSEEKLIMQSFIAGVSYAIAVCKGGK